MTLFAVRLSPESRDEGLKMALYLPTTCTDASLSWHRLC